MDSKNIHISPALGETFPLLLPRILQESTQVSAWNIPRSFLDFRGSLRRFILNTAKSLSGQSVVYHRQIQNTPLSDSLPRFSATSTPLFLTSLDLAWAYPCLLRSPLCHLCLPLASIPQILSPLSVNLSFSIYTPFLAIFYNGPCH